MKGSVQIKNSKYYMVISYKANGKWKYKWMPTGLDVKGNNKRKAEQMLQTTLATLCYDDISFSCDCLLSDYISIWLKSTKIGVGETTYRGYEFICQRHIIPYFNSKGYKIDKVKKYQLQEYLNDKYESGKINGEGGLSAKTLYQHKIILQLVFKFALENNIIKTNPCQNLKLPSLSHREPTFYTKSQVTDLLNSIKDSELYPLIYVTLSLGLRRSEVLGIKWDSIDFERKILTIKHTVVNYRGTIEKDSTKNNASFRTYPLNDKLIDIFQMLKADEKTNQELFGKSYYKCDYVFKWNDGKPYRPDYVTSKFSKLLKQNNLPHIRFHDLRHTCASLLIDNNYQLKDIQEWLGHADIQTTANIYGHIDIERKKNISNNMLNLL